MRKSNKHKIKILNQKGQLTLDFLFAIVLILGISTLLSALTFALTFTEIIQYVSYAGARSYLAGDTIPNNQIKAAEDKVTGLLKALPFIGAKDWVQVTNRKADNFKSNYDGQGVDVFRNQFTGYRIDFKLPILGLKIPLLGPAITPPGGGQTGAQPEEFKATVSSYLMREPTTDECMRYNNNILKALVNLNGAYGSALSNVSNGPENFVAINDNGC